jgi:uncharacterized protein YndB with AHSA1/START domain
MLLAESDRDGQPAVFATELLLHPAAKIVQMLKGGESMLVRILIVVNIVIAAILLFAATKPDTLRVERSIQISAPPARVFALLNDFHQWPQWAPQDKDDPSMTRTYSGASSGVGAISQWHGRGSTGRGRMEIVESVPDAHEVVQTDFVKPFAAHNRNEFTLEPAGETTRLTWTMQGSNLYVMKVMSVFINMDREAGKHFEAGLANLKTAAEK